MLPRRSLIDFLRIPRTRFSIPSYEASGVKTRTYVFFMITCKRAGLEHEWYEWTNFTNF